jgi:hypothetical protein
LYTIAAKEATLYNKSLSVRIVGATIHRKFYTAYSIYLEGTEMNSQLKPRKPNSRGLLSGIIGGAFVAVILVVAFYWLPWPGLGFDGYTPPERTQPIKTLWDLLELLIVPVVLLVGGVLLDRRERERDRFEAEQRASIERERIDEAARENVLQHYLDRISELLISGAFDAVNPNQIEPGKTNALQRRKNAALIVVTRTLQVLHRLGSDRKRRDSIFKFLRDSELIGGSEEKISFQKSDFSGLDLSDVRVIFTNFTGANFSGADLSRAMIRGCDFTLANFKNANLTGAILMAAQLDNADIEGAIFTDAWVSTDQIRTTKNYTKAILPERIATELNVTP